MNEKKDKWEQLTEIPQDYEVNPDLIKKAESAMRQERRTNRRNVHVWQTVAGSLAACCLLLIMIPAFRSLGNGPITPPDSSSSSTEERYFDEGSIVREDADIIEVVEANHLQIKYYNDETVTSKIGKIKDTDELAIIYQSMFCFDTWDEVSLMISLKPNDCLLYTSAFRKKFILVFGRGRFFVGGVAGGSRAGEKRLPFSVVRRFHARSGAAFDG